jgi:hypothetical protein
MENIWSGLLRGLSFTVFGGLFTPTFAHLFGHASHRSSKKGALEKLKSIHNG